MPIILVDDKNTKSSAIVRIYFGRAYPAQMSIILHNLTTITGQRIDFNCGRQI